MLVQSCALVLTCAGCCSKDSLRLVDGGALTGDGLVALLDLDLGLVAHDTATPLSEGCSVRVHGAGVLNELLEV
jgi:hypothetical protein